MEGCVQVISKEMIKPSSQTPLHPKTLKLSCTDRVLASLYIPLIFFYEADKSRNLTSSNHLPILQRLKQTLIDTLPSFYPLSGRLKNNLTVDCNDSGVEFVEARVRGHLKDAMFLDHDQLKQYLPWYCTELDHGKNPQPLLAVQITLFDCGGVVIGVGISHSVADLVSAMAFLEAWAAASRGGEETGQIMSFGTTNFFPSLWFLPLSMVQRVYLCDENFRTKRFIFDKEKLDILRQIATSKSSEPSSAINDPSRVELVSAFIWKHFMATRLKNGKTYAALHAVNVRSRTTPPQLLENVFGNCVALATAYAAPNGGVEDLHLHELIGRLRRSIRRVRDDYIMKPLNRESSMKDLFKLVALVLMGKVEWCWFTSWLGFPIYELDYGWGKPIWFTTPSMMIKNLIVLVNSKSGEGVEAIVNMIPDDLQILESQINLISNTN